MREGKTWKGKVVISKNGEPKKENSLQRPKTRDGLQRLWVVIVPDFSAYICTKVLGLEGEYIFVDIRLSPFTSSNRVAGLFTINLSCCGWVAGPAS